MKRDLEVQVNELQTELSREQTEVSRLRDHNSQLCNQISDKENKQVKVQLHTIMQVVNWRVILFWWFSECSGYITISNTHCYSY